MSLQLSVKVDEGKVKSKVANAILAVANLPARVVRPEVEQARADVVDPYPPELPGQKYIRTFKRQAATRVVAASGNNQYTSKYTIQSTPNYGRGQTGNPYVLGDAKGQGQAAIHRGRWKTLYSAMSAAVGRIVAKGQEYFRAVIERDQIP